MSALPTGFKDLSREELYRSALEDFAVDVKEGDSAKVVQAALLENGVTWEMYVQQHPEVLPPKAEKPTPPVANPNVVTAEQVRPTRSTDFQTKEPEHLVNEKDYLVKMNRENPYFEFRGYRFTQDKPFAIMPADMTNRILTEETGFAIATPAEAQEFYGL